MNRSMKAAISPPPERRRTRRQKKNAKRRQPANVNVDATKASSPTVAEVEVPAVVQPVDEALGRWSNGLEWPSVFWIGLVHVGALAAPWCFTWKGLAVFAVLSWLTGCLGVCLGYHRLLTHVSFQTFPVLRRFFGVLGLLSGEGPPVTWVAVHRKHHHYSDKPGDPHSPHDGAWWSHILWLFPRPRQPEWTAMIDRYGKDLLKDRFLRSLDRTYLLWHMALGLGLFAAGWAGWDLFTGISFLVYGMFARLVWVMHITWAVNSASHLWGYRNYETTDDSRNLWWVALFAFGEGWHNNHHAFAHCARHGHRWWEVDVTYLTICALEKCGLAWNVSRSRRVGHLRGKKELGIRD